MGVHDTVKNQVPIRTDLNPVRNEKKCKGTIQAVKYANRIEESCGTGHFLAPFLAGDSADSKNSQTNSHSFRIPHKKTHLDHVGPLGANTRYSMLVLKEVFKNKHTLRCFRRQSTEEWSSSGLHVEAKAPLPRLSGIVREAEVDDDAPVQHAVVCSGRETR